MILGRIGLGSLAGVIAQVRRVRRGLKLPSIEFLIWTFGYFPYQHGNTNSDQDMQLFQMISRLLSSKNFLRSLKMYCYGEGSFSPYLTGRLCFVWRWRLVACWRRKRIAILVSKCHSKVRKLELLISMLVFVMAACYFGELSYVKPPAGEVIKGLFVSKLNGDGVVGDAIALVGALVMPHNLFLHSALVLSRKRPESTQGINVACRYFLLESGFALFVALLINIAVISVSGTVCHASNLSADNMENCSDLTLNSASFLLKNVLGK